MTEPSITTILKKYGLLDEEEYLVHPEHKNVIGLFNKLVKARSLLEDGKVITEQQKIELEHMQIAVDYYDEVLDEEAVRLAEEEGIVEEEEEDDFEEVESTEDEEDDEDEGDEPESSGEPLIDEVAEMDIDSDEDATFEP